MIQKDKVHLTDGSAWEEHEDCIVGDEAGLNNLINACQIAIEKEKYYGSDLGEYVGVKKLDSKVFYEPTNTGKTHILYYVYLFVLLVTIALVLIGIGTVFSWIF